MAPWRITQWQPWRHVLLSGPDWQRGQAAPRPGGAPSPLDPWTSRKTVTKQGDRIKKTQQQPTRSEADAFSPSRASIDSEPRALVALVSLTLMVRFAWNHYNEKAKPKPKANRSPAAAATITHPTMLRFDRKSELAIRSSQTLAFVSESWPGCKPLRRARQVSPRDRSRRPNDRRVTAPHPAAWDLRAFVASSPSYL